MSAVSAYFLCKSTTTMTQSTLSVPTSKLQESVDAFSLNPNKPNYTCLPVPNPTKSFWLDSTPNANPLAKEGSTGPLSDTGEADICIIGSGITGVSAAYHLACTPGWKGKEPLKVVILEARYFCQQSLVWAFLFAYCVVELIWLLEYIGSGATGE